MSLSDSDKPDGSKKPATPAQGTLARAPSASDSKNDIENPIDTSIKESNTDLQETTIFGDRSDADALLIDGFTIKYVESGARKPSTPVSIRGTVTSKLPGFRLIEELGRGAYGVVFRAEDEMLQRHVAIKMPLFRDPKLRNSYISEARKAVSLEHHSIVPIYHVGTTDDNQPFVVQKLIDGPTLRKVLGENKGLPILQSVRLIREVALAADAAHNAGVVHRDLKPDNLLIDSKGHPWVADFGLALGEEDQTKHRGEIAGTPCYMSPEQLVGRADWLDGRSDIWAIGVMLYEMLVGKLPFEGSSFDSLKEQICEREPRPIHQRVPEVPSELDQIFRKCCAKKVTDRFASGRELAAALDDFLALTDLTEDFSPSNFKSLHSAIGDARSTQVLTSRNRSRMRTTAGASQNTTMRKTIEISAKAALPLSLLFCGISILGAAWLFWQVRHTVPAKPNERGSETELLANIPVDKPPAPGDVQPPKVDENSDSNGVPPAATPSNELPATEPSTPEVPPKPKRPFRVAIDGSGTHDSLQKAIDDAEPDEVILLAPGTYAESLKIDKNVTLNGDANADVKMLGLEKPCLLIGKGVILTVNNMTLISQGPETNVIEVRGGTVQLQNCKLATDSYDCLKLFDGSSAVVKACTLTSALHPAISAKNSMVNVEASQFRFHNENTEKKLEGIQTTACECLVSGCSFIGTCYTAVSAVDSKDKKVSIKNCEFSKCDSGVLLERCFNAELLGDEAAPSKFIGCKNPIYILDSKIDLKHLQIEFEGKQKNIGLQFLRGAVADVSNISVKGYAAGVGVLKSHVKLTNSNIAECVTGIFCDSSKIIAEQVTLKSIEETGIVGTGIGNTLEAKDLTTEKCLIGIFAMAGQFTFNQTKFKQIDTSMLIGSNKEAFENMQLPSFYSPSGIRYKLEIDPGSVPIVKSTQGLTIDSIACVIRFIGPGRIEIHDLKRDNGGAVTLVDIVRYQKPLKHRGNSLAEFEVFESDKTN